MNDLNSKIVILTGASGGIGRAIMDAFLPKVQHLITSSRSDLGKLVPMADAPANRTHIQGDLTQEEDVSHLFEEILEKWGRVDILINCVGGSLFNHPLEEFPVEEFDRVIAVNLRSAFLLTKAAIHSIKRNGEAGGNIVHIVSAAAERISHGKGPYGIAKAGLARLIHYAADETGRYNMKINGISPNYVFTSRHEEEIQEKAQKTRKTIQQLEEEIFDTQLLRKKMLPEMLVDVVILLATTEVITGQIYNVSMGQILEY